MGKVGANEGGEMQGHVGAEVDRARMQIEAFVESAVAQLKEGAAESASQSVADLRAQTQEYLDSELQQRMAALREAAKSIAAETEERINRVHGDVFGKLQENSALLEHSIARAGATVSQLDQYSERLGTTQQ